MRPIGRPRCGLVALSSIPTALSGCSIRLQFAGRALAPHICPALEHLAIDDAAHPDLTVCLWDTASTGKAPPPPPWGPYDYLDRGAIRGYNTRRIRTAYYVGPGVLSMLDHERNLALYWLRDASEHPVYMTGSPLLAISELVVGGTGAADRSCRCSGTGGGRSAACGQRWIGQVYHRSRLPCFRSLLSCR